MGSNDMPAELGNRSADYLVTFAKAALSAVPGIGSPLAEFISAVVPKQRLDRVVHFIAALEARLTSLEQSRFAKAMQDQAFGDMLEEAVRQAAGALSDERCSYLAALVHEALDDRTVSAIEAKHVLRLLGEMNDVEVIVLRSYLVQELNGDAAFRELHSNVLDPVPVHLNSGQSELDRQAFWEGYRFHLSRLGLLDQVLSVDRKTGLPLIARGGKRLQTAGYELSAMGRLMLRLIGLSSDGFSPAN